MPEHESPYFGTRLAIGGPRSCQTSSSVACPPPAPPVSGQSQSPPPPLNLQPLQPLRLSAHLLRHRQHHSPEERAPGCMLLDVDPEYWDLTPAYTARQFVGGICCPSSASSLFQGEVRLPSASTLANTKIQRLHLNLSPSGLLKHLLQ